MSIKIALRTLSVSLCCGLMLASAFAQPDVEPNDTTSHAAQLSLPFYSASGIVSSYDDVDYYKFSAIAGNEVTIWLATTSIGSQLVPMLGFHDSTGQLLAYNDKEWNFRDSCACGDSILYLKIPHDGTYYISVTSASRFRHQAAFQTGAAGPYQLYLLTTFGTEVSDGNELNDTRNTAKAITLPFSSYDTELSYFGDIDWFRFTAKKGNLISIDIDAQELVKPGSDMMVRSRLGLFDENGRLLQTSDSGKDPADGYTGDPAILIEIPKDGTYYIAVTPASDTQFSTLFSDPHFLLDPYVSGAEKLIGHYRLKVRALQDLLFPQVANGSFGSVDFSTTVVLVNNSGQTTTGSVQLFKPDGSPLTTSFLPSNATGSSCWFSVAPGGSTIIRTDGLGPGSSGYAIVRSDGTLGGAAFVSEYGSDGNLITEAGVPPSAPESFFAFPVDITGSFNTGVAVANLGASRANLTFKLVDGTGKTLAARSIPLDVANQISIYVSGRDQLFPTITSFRGSLQIVSDAPVAAVALRSSPETLTTLPPVSLNQSFQPVELTLPQIVVGSGGESSYRSTVALINPGYFPVSGEVRFTRSDGTPMVVVSPSASSPSHRFSIPAQGTVFLEFSHPGDLQWGYATVTADHGIGGTLIYSQRESKTGTLQSEVGVGFSSAWKSFFVFAESEAGYNTGVALANTNPGVAKIEFSLQAGNEGEPVETAPDLLLDPGRQFATLVAGVDQLFPDFSGRGTLRITASNPIAAVALRITAKTMTVLPVVPAP